MRLLFALCWVLASLLIFNSAEAQEDFIQKYILSGKPVEVLFGAYGFANSKWIGRCEPETATKLCGKTYIGIFNNELRSWEFVILDDQTGTIQKYSSHVSTKGDPLDYKMLIWDEEFSFDEKGNLLHSGDGKVGNISPGDLVPTKYQPDTTEVPESGFTDYRRKGIDSLQDYQYQEAIASFNKALLANPSDTILYFYRGYSYLRLQQYDRAVADLEKATMLDQTNADAFSSLAAAYLEQKKYEDVISNATKAIILNPKDAASYFNRGIAYNFTKRYDEAYRDFEEVVNLEPNNEDAIINRDLLLKKVQNE